MREKRGFLGFLTVIFVIAFIVFLILGFFHLADSKAYVGGDAYNFIINAGKAIAFFILAFGFFITCFIIELIVINKAKYSCIEERISIVNRLNKPEITPDSKPVINCGEYK